MSFGPISFSAGIALLLPEYRLWQVRRGSGAPCSRGKAGRLPERHPFSFPPLGKAQEKEGSSGKREGREWGRQGGSEAVLGRRLSVLVPFSSFSLCRPG